ncbi:TFIIH/NER complex subunit [Zalaria obscura]|uniref:TFIIH/NER complex subunit n=1 Tax=Zalaria obscura TaxID=2024903 RepID=A0ACC3SLC4_9PEZI
MTVSLEAHGKLPIFEAILAADLPAHEPHPPRSPIHVSHLVLDVRLPTFVSQLTISPPTMSRLAQSRAAPAAARPGDQDGELLQHSLSQLRFTDAQPEPDICPVCKSSRYLNKSMQFLVNPECYHKMCESCVDRIFSHGPNKCPIAGCNRTLRKHRFRKQTFEDIAVEREVDIRKRVAAIFNRREDEFEDLMDYNNYLNDVEDITFNLVNRIDVEENEKKLAAYAEQNSKSISANASLASQETQDYSALQAAEREQARLRRDTARREEEEERRARAEGRQDIINRLASGTASAEQIAQESRVTLKKRMDKKAAAERQRQLHAAAAAKDATNGSSGFLIKGLKTKKEVGPEKPFDAFGGLSFAKHDYCVLQDHYEWDWLNEVRGDVQIVAGGYDVQEFHQRALCDAFAGLGVFVGEEAAARDEAAMGPGAVKAAATAGAAGACTGAKDIKMEDPF